MNSKLICFMGAPCSGKSTLASGVHSELKRINRNSIFIPEIASDYIAEYGIPSTPIDQLTIFYKQVNRERMYLGSKDFIICDSSALLNYFYFRTLFNNPLSNKDIATINHMQKEILKTLGSWSHIFYLPPMLSNPDDGIRFHDVDQIKKLDTRIKSYLEMENIPHIDLSGVKITDRQEFAIKTILK